MLLASCKTSAPLVSARPSPKPGPTTASTAPGTPVPASPRPSVASLDSVALSGKIQLDAGYIVAQGGGNIVAQGGGNIVAQGGGNVIQAKQDLAALGAQLIGNDGAGAVAAVDAGLISNDGGSLITNDGAGIVAQGGGNFHVLSDADVATGELPAAGMAVQAIDPATNRPIYMVDGRGHIGKFVLSDAAGNFKLFIPRALQGNVVIQAQPPAKLADARLRLNRIVKAGEQLDVGVDEATTLALDFCRLTFQTKLDVLVVENDTGAIKDTHLGKDEIAILESLRGEINGAFQAGGVRTFTPRQRRALTALVANYVLGKLSLSDVRIDRTVEAYDGPDEAALVAIEAVLRKAQANARTKLAGDPAYFERQAYLKDYNAFVPTIQRRTFKVQTAADVGAFIGEAYVAGNDYINHYSADGSTFSAIVTVLGSIGDAEANADAKRLEAGINGMSRAVIFKFGEKLDDIKALIASMAKPEVRAQLDAIDTEGR